MSKSVWIFNHYAMTPDMPGGSRHYDLSKELVKRGYDVTVFASSFNYNRYVEMRLSENESWKIEMVNGVRFVWLKTPPYNGNGWRRVVNMFAYAIRSYSLGRKINRVAPSVPKPDIIIGSTVHLLSVLSAHKLARRYGARFIMEVRDLWPQTLIDIGAISQKSATARAMYMLEKYLYKRAEKIITLLPLACDYITECGIDSDKIIWLPNGVDLSRCKNNGNGQVRSDQHFQILYLGTHGRVNALDILLDAAQSVQNRGYKDIKFVLVGDGPEKQSLISRKEELGLTNIEFRDPIPKCDVPECLSKADAFFFVLLNMELYKYGISFNKIFDYLAAGKPIIMAGNPVNNIIRDADCGLSIPPEDAGALADAAISLYEMESEERKSMGKRGYEYVKKNHDISILADRLIECIEETCGNI